ncbi:hypothetical protein AAFC00_000282 [Neodothiora populina]|uniref:PRELI/MSF1 domain-containing protein n=1 Tax=Neodothiora populina TaxID=2781224 RepID=A0ABR3PCD4_9PEZI
MVRFYSSTDSYPYSFPAVTLAYFLRYPNPYSTHVESSDVLSRNFDPVTQKLTTVRLHLKKSKLPSAVLKLLPGSILGAGKDGSTQSYILEKSTVDVKNGSMETESQNLEWTGVLSVVERQVFRRPAFPGVSVQQQGDLFNTDAQQQTTDVETSVTLHSHIGENIRKRRAARAEQQDEDKPRLGGFLRQWANGSIQKSIEVIGLRRAEKSQPKAKEGMKVVLERMRKGGLKGVLDGMRRDRDTISAGGFATGKEDPETGVVEVRFDDK